MRIYADTNVGIRRTSNQDTYRFDLVTDNFSWSLVCDGMGGVNGGDVASNIAADKIKEILGEKLNYSLSDEEITDVMVNAVNEGNSEIFSKAVDCPELKGMGTTAVLSVVKDNKLFVAHVGDSRAYLFSQGSVSQITEDHSYVQDLVNRGEISKEEARFHPHKNIITRSLGVHSMVEIDVNMFTVSEGDVLVVCSDGLSDYITDEQLADFIKENEENSLVDFLIKYALNCGGNDNITVLTVCV